MKLNEIDLNNFVYGIQNKYSNFIRFLTKSVDDGFSFSDITIFRDPTHKLFFDIRASKIRHYSIV